jgi:hypothetical protein
VAACRVRAGVNTSRQRKATGDAVWQIKVTPQGAIGPMSTIALACPGGVITNRDNELTSCDNRESRQDRWQSNCRVIDTAGQGAV